MKSIAGSTIALFGYITPGVVEVSPLLENLSFLASISSAGFTIYQIIKSTRKRNGSNKG